MSSLADLPELVGFFSYSRDDDVDSQGALSALRNRIQGELRSQLGRTTKTFRLWQDKEAIPSGTLWESEIKNAVAQAAFFIPIITPTVVASPHCKFELESFLAREAELGRDDLVFPILYIDVPGLEESAQRHRDPVLSLIAKRQYKDWREFRYLDVNSTEVRREVARFCTHIRDALRRPRMSSEERKPQEERMAPGEAEAERRRQEAEARRRAEVEGRRAAGLEAAARADAERRRRESEAPQQPQQKAEAQPQDTEPQRQREGAQAQPHAEKEQRDTLHLPRAGHKSRLALIVGSLAGVVVLGATGVWFATRPTPAPVAPPPAPTAPPPAPPAAPSPTVRAPIPGLSVALGDTIDQVRTAYGLRGDPTNGCSQTAPCLMLSAPANGLKFFFKTGKELLYMVRADAPFSGSIDGVHIGDALDSLLARFGQPTTTPWDFAGKKAYLFRVNGVSLRCDINNARKVDAIFYFND